MGRQRLKEFSAAIVGGIVGVVASLALSVAAQTWTSPMTATGGAVFTASQFNTHVRDNLNVLRGGGIAITSQAAGDLIYASTSAQLGRVPITASGIVRGNTGGTAPEFVAQSTLKLDDFGAPDDNTDLDATTSAHGLLPKLGGGTTNFLRADGTWAAPSGGGLDDGDTASNTSTSVSSSCNTYTTLASVTLTGLSSATVMAHYAGFHHSGNATTLKTRITIDSNAGTRNDTKALGSNDERAVVANHLRTSLSGSITVVAEACVSGGTHTVTGQLVALAVR